MNKTALVLILSSLPLVAIAGGCAKGDVECEEANEFFFGVLFILDNLPLIVFLSTLLVLAVVVSVFFYINKKVSKIKNTPQ